MRRTLTRAASVLALLALTAGAASAQPNVTLTVDQSTISENNGVATLTATIPAATDQETTVTLGASNVNAEGGDFSFDPANGIIVIPAGSRTGTLRVTGRNDTDTADEQFALFVDRVNGTAVTNGDRVAFRIADDDDPATLTISASPTTIGEDNGQSTITVRLDEETNEDITVTLATDGDADGSSLSSTTITIPRGQLEGTTTLDADDDDDSDNETVTVSIDDVDGGNVTVGTPSSVTITVTDDDAAAVDNPVVSLSVSPDDIDEGGQSTITATVTGDATGQEAITVSLDYDGEDDDDTTPDTITIPAGANSGSVTFVSDDDDDDDSDDTVTVSISDVDGRDAQAADDGGQTASITVRDNDDAPFVTLEADPTRIAADGGRSTITVRLSNRSDQDVTVDLSYSGSADDDDDFDAPDQIVVPAGRLSATGLLTTSGDDDDDDGQTIVVDIDDVDNGTEDNDNGEQQVTITLDEDLNAGDATVSFAAVQSTVSEGAGTFPLQIELSEALDTDVEVRVTLSQGDGADLGGFTTRTVTVPAGQTSVTVPIDLTDDNIREGDRTFSFQLATSDSRLQVDRGTTTVTVTDDDVTALVINEVDGIVGPMGYRFVELRVSNGVPGETDGLTLALYGADSTVVATQSLDGFDTGDDGFLVVCDDDGDDDVCDVEVDIDDELDAGGFSGIALFRGDGPDEGDDFDSDDDDDLIDSVFIDERAAAVQRGLVAENGSLQRQDSGRFAFVAPPTPGAANNVGIAVPNEPTIAAEVVGNVFPNPSAGRAALELTVASAQTVTVSVFDALGRQVAVAYDGMAQPGAAVRVSLDGAAMAPGLYIVRVAGETFTEARRLTVTR